MKEISGDNKSRWQKTFVIIFSLAVVHNVFRYLLPDRNSLCYQIAINHKLHCALTSFKSFFKRRSLLHLCILAKVSHLHEGTLRNTISE